MLCRTEVGIPARCGLHSDRVELDDDGVRDMFPMPLSKAASSSAGGGRLVLCFLTLTLVLVEITDVLTLLIARIQQSF